MEHKGDEQPWLNAAGQPHSLEQSTVPASLLPSVLSRLGLGDLTSLSLTEVDKQLAALKDEEIPVRVAAVRSLGEHGETSAIGLLLAALHDSAWEVRAAAVWTLGKFGEQAPLEALMRATDDEDGSVRAAALRTLELLGEQKPIEPLMRALGDSDWQVREIATLTLGEIGEQAPLEPLLARLNDEHTAVRAAARMALEQSHPEALSAISIEPIMITQESGSNTVSGVREQEQPGPGVGVEAQAKVPSTGDSTLIQLSAHVKTLLSRMVRDVVAPLADTRSTPADEEVSDVIVSGPGEMEAHPQPIQIKPRRFRHIAEGVLAALIIAGLVSSWLIIQQRLHPSQGSTSLPLLAYHGHAEGPAVWSSDSKYVSFLADSTPASETVLVWNRATGQVTKHMLHTLLAQSQEHQAVFASDGKHLAFVERDASSKVAVQVWDVVAWRSIFRTYYSSPNGELAVYWSPDSTRLVIPAEDGTIQVWNVVTGHELATCHVPPFDLLPVNTYVSPDGHSVIIGFGPQNTYLLDLKTCKLLTLPSVGAVTIFWSPQGNRFATVSHTDYSMVQIWDAHTWHNLASFHLSAPLSGLVWTPDGTRIVTLGDKEVDILDVATQRIVLQVVPTRIDLLPVLALSPDGERIASLSGADTVQIWDAVTGRKLNVYQSPGNSVKVVAWSPDSRTLATGSTDGTVRVWNADRSLQSYHSDSSAVLNIAWSPDGKSIATGNVSGSMWVWKVN
jgi:WD40 repeat protein